MSAESKPNWWFRPIHDQNGLKSNPMKIEYLKMWTGETFIHCNGTAYWNGCGLDKEALTFSGVTHYRIITDER